MVQEIFIVEDKNKITKELLKKFKEDKEIHLRTVPSRRFSRAFIRHSFFDTYKWRMFKE